MNKYCLVVNFPDWDTNPDFDYYENPGAGNLLQVVYGDTFNDLYDESNFGMMFQLYAMDTGERVGCDMYNKYNLMKAIAYGESHEHTLPGTDWYKELKKMRSK